MSVASKESNADAEKKPQSSKTPGIKPAKNSMLAKLKHRFISSRPWLGRQGSKDSPKTSAKPQGPLAKRSCAPLATSLSEEADVRKFDAVDFAHVSDLTDEEKAQVGRFENGRFLCPEPVLKYVAECGCVFKFHRYAESSLVDGAAEYYCLACELKFKSKPKFLQYPK